MPTKFYFQNETASPVVAAFHTGWSGASQGSRWNMYPFLSTSYTTGGRTIDFAGAGANNLNLDRQYISEPLFGAQIISGSCSGRLQVQEFVTNDNADQIIISLRLVARTGGFIRATGLNLGHYGSTTAEFGVAYRTKSFASGTAITPMTGQDGDRIVLDIGYNATAGGTTPQASARWGDTGIDLPINETQTLAGAPWFSLGNVDLVFSHNSATVF